MGTNTFRLSRETKKELGENSDFFSALDPLNQELKLEPKGSDVEARTETQTQPNGDVQVVYVYPLDNNPNPEDGRLYLKDEFIFDPQETQLKSYQRSFELHPSVQNNAEWKGWLGKYQGSVQTLQLGDPKLQHFAFRVAQTYSRPLTDQIKEALNTQLSYLATASSVARTFNPDWQVRVGKSSFFSRVYRNGELVLTLTLPVDNDTDPANGRLLVSDHFTLDPYTLKLKSFSRSWGIAPETEGATRNALKPVVKALNEKAAPADEEAQGFLQTFLPTTGIQPIYLGPSAVDAPAKKEFPYSNSPGGFGARAIARRQNEASQKKSTEDSLKLGLAVASDVLERKYDATKGVLNFSSKIDRNQVQGLLEGVFQKARDQAAGKPGLTVPQLLETLELRDEERQALRLVQSDRVFQKYAAIAGETDSELRSHQLYALAKEDLIPKGMGGAVQFLLAGELQAQPKRAAELISFMQGKGGFGTQFERLLPQFAEHATDPWMLAAMGGASILGPMGEAGVLKLLHRFGPVGSVGSAGARISGLGIESLAFNTLHRAGASLFHNPGKAWDHFGSDVVSGTLLFGALRLAHGGSGYVGGRLAEGRVGTLFGGRMPDGTFALTRWGNRAGGILNHGSAIFTMAGVAGLSEAVGLHPASDRGVGGHFFDATVMYTQAMVGFRLANGLSNGALVSEIGDIRLRLREQYLAVALDPAAGPKIPAWEGLFTRRQEGAKKAALARWEKTQDKHPRISRAQTRLAAWLAQRPLSEKAVAQVLTDARDIKEPSALAKGMEKFWSGLGSRLGNWAPTKGIIEYFSFWRVSRQRSVRKEILGLQEQIKALGGDKEAALRRAADQVDELERLQSALDDLIDQHLPDLVEDPSQISTPEGRKLQKERIKEKFNQLLREKEEAQRGKEEAEAQALAKDEEIRRRDERLAQLQRLVGELEKKTSELDGANQELQGKAEGLQTEKSAAEKRAGDAEARGEELEGKLNEAEQEKGRLRAQNDSIEGDKAELEGRILGLSAELETKTKAHAAAQAEALARGREITALSSQLEELQTELSDLNTPVIRFEDLPIELAWAQEGKSVNSIIAFQYLQDAQTVVQNFRARLQAVTQHAEELQKQLSELEAKGDVPPERILPTYDAFRSRVADADRLIGQLENAKALELHTRIKFLELRLLEEEQARRQERQQAEIEVGKRDTQLEKSHAETLAAREETDQSVAQMKGELEAAQAELERFRRIESDRDALRRQLDEALGLSAHHEGEAKSAAEAAEKARRELDTTQGQLRESQERIGTLDAEAHARQGELADANRLVGTLGDDVARLVEENERLDASIRDKDAEITAINQELATARERLEAEDVTGIAISEAEEALQRRIEELEGDKTNLEADLGESRSKHSLAVTAVNSARGELARMTQAKNDVQLELEREREKYRKLDEEFRSLHEEAQGADQRYAAASLKWDGERSILERQIDTLERSLGERNEELQRLAQGHETELQEKEAAWLQNAKEGLEAQAREFRGALSQQEEWARASEARATVEEQRANKALEDVVEAEEREHGLRRELGEANAARETADAKAAENEEIALRNYEAYEQYKGEFERVKGELGDAQAQLEVIQQQIREAPAPASAELHKRVAELEAKLRDLERDNAELIVEVDRARKELSDHLKAATQVISEDHAEIQARRESRNVQEARALALGEQVAGLERQVLDITTYLDGLRNMFRSRAQALISPTVLYGGMDPRKQLGELTFNSIATLYDSNNLAIGKSHVISGGRQGSMFFFFPDGSKILGKTSVGHGRTKQEDGIYAAYYELPGKILVKDVTGSDGAGGQSAGHRSQGYWLLGNHAALRDAAYAGRIVTPSEKFEAGVTGVDLLNAQIKPPPGREATGSGTTFVAFGDQAMAATAGDSTLFWLRKRPNGLWELKGYSNVDGLIDDNLAMFKKNIITSGIHQRRYHLYRIDGLKPGDVVIQGSDGLWESLLGDEYKRYGSTDTRQHNNLRSPDQANFERLTRLLQMLEGRDDIAEFLHDVALSNMSHPGQTVQVGEREVQLPAEKADGDNIFVQVYIQGNSPSHNFDLPPEYLPLEPVLDWDMTQRRREDADKSTAKGKKSDGAAEELTAEDLEAIDEFQPAPPPPPPSSRERRAPTTPAPDAIPEDEATQRIYADYFFPPELQSVVFGREKGDIGEHVQVIPDSAVSRIQVRIRRNGNKFTIEHLGRNATLVKQKTGFSVLLEKPHQTAEIKDGDRVMIGNAGFVFRSERPAPDVPKYLDPSQPQVIALYSQYSKELRALYGANGDFVGSLLARVYANFPELETVFNPKLMHEVPAGAAGRHAQEILLATLAKALDQALSNGGKDAMTEAARKDIETLKQAGKPLPVIDTDAILGLMQKYSKALTSVYFSKSKDAAQHFAFLYSINPKLETEFNPKILAERDPENGIKAFRRPQHTFFPDKQLLTEKEIYDQASKGINDLKTWYEQFLLAAEIAPGVWKIRPGKGVVLGRNGEADLSLPDPEISSKHFRLFQENGQWNIEDLQSTNGTFVNSFRLNSGGRQPLNTGDTVVAGHQWLRFELQADDSAHLTWLRPAVQNSGVAQNPAEPVNPWQQGQGFITEIPASGDLTALGRIQLPHDLVSGKHVEFIYSNQVWHVRDGGSSNGTLLIRGAQTQQIARDFVPQQPSKIAGEWHVLYVNDRLVIGPYLLEVELLPNGNLGLKQLPWSYQEQPAQAYAPVLPFFQDGKLHMGHAQRMVLQTVRKGELGIKPDASLGEHSYVFTVDTAFFFQKRFGVIENLNGVTVLRVDTPGIAISSGGRTTQPKKGEEVILRPGDTITIEGKEINFVP